MPTARKAGVWKLIGIIALVFLIGAIVAIRFVIDRAEPIVKARIVQTLSTRFHSKVELESFGVSLADGIQVSGSGLKIFGATDPNPHEPGMQALIDIREFRFQPPCVICFIRQCTLTLCM